MTEDGREESQDITTGNAGQDEGEQNTSDLQPSTSTHKKVYDPETCKKMRKLSSAQMQQQEIKMRQERQNAFINTMKSIVANNAPATNAVEKDNGDSEFTKMIEKQMSLVYRS